MRDFKNFREFVDYALTDPTIKKITFRSLTKMSELSVQPATDLNGKWLGIKEPSLISREEMESGKYIAKPETTRTISDGYEMDLSNEIDREDLKWLKYCKEFMFSKKEALFQVFPTPMFFVDLPDYENTVKLTSFQAKKKAFDLVENTPEDELKFICKKLNVDMSDADIKTIKVWLLDTADSSKEGAEKIISILEAPDYKVELFALKVLDAGIIKQESGIYKYGNVVIGFTYEVLKEFLKDRVKNKEVIDSIIQELEPAKKQPIKK